MAHFTTKPQPVVARQVHKFEVVACRLGEIALVPGDWIVTDEWGQDIPVRDRHFRRLYEPSDKEGCQLMGHACGRCPGNRCPHAPQAA